MRIRILSDIHLEFWEFEPPDVVANVVVLAGDISEGAAGLRWARAKFANTPILYVIGNHELYGQRLPDAHGLLIEEARRLGIHLLENTAVVVDNVRFLGATLWTDYALYAHSEERRTHFMFAAQRRMSDYRRIRFGPKRRKQRDRMRPEHVLAMHQTTRQWLQKELAAPFDGKTVVITHHAPHRNSVPTRFAGDEHTPCLRIPPMSAGDSA